MLKSQKRGGEKEQKGMKMGVKGGMSRETMSWGEKNPQVFKHVMMHLKNHLGSPVIVKCKRMICQRTLTLVALSFFSHCSLSFSISVTLNRRSVTSWYKPWGGEKNSHYPLNSKGNLHWRRFMETVWGEISDFFNSRRFLAKGNKHYSQTDVPLERIWAAQSTHRDKSWTKGKRHGQLLWNCFYPNQQQCRSAATWRNWH